MTNDTTPAHQQQTVEENYDLIDMLDDQQTMAELSGRVVDEYVYKVNAWNPDKKCYEDTYRLSKVGTNWACREYAKRGEMIRVVGHPNVVVDPGDPEYIMVTVIAERVKRDKGREIVMDNRVGPKRQWRKLEHRDKTIHQNPYFFEHAVAKAERNAKGALLEADFVRALIDGYLKRKGKVRDATGNPQQSSQQQAPAQRSAAPAGQPAQKQTAPAQGAKTPATPTPGGQKTAAKPPKREGAAPSKQQAPTQQPPAKPEEKNDQKTRTLFFALLGNLGYKSEEAKKDAFHWYLPGYDSSRLVPEADLVTFCNTIRDVLEGKNEITEFENGHAIVHRESQQVLYPKGFVGVPKGQVAEPESGKDPF